jgi:hypothetical protein
MTQPTTLARPFGCVAEDLGFDFERSDRAALVTTLLAACATPPDAQHWWRQTVGTRIDTLLKLLRASEGHDVLTIAARCPACEAPFEIELAHDALAGLEAAAVDVVELQGEEGAALRLRRPAGDDLRAWHEQAPTTRELALRNMLARLSIGGEPGAADAARATSALAEADPLVAFSAACTCPVCGHEAEREIDLEGLALQRLAARQRALLREVHVLASRYGWTEREILAVAPERRAKYLEMVEGSA